MYVEIMLYVYIYYDDVDDVDDVDNVDDDVEQ